jgi:hypothetical protein
MDLSRGLGDVYKRQDYNMLVMQLTKLVKYFMMDIKK